MRSSTTVKDLVVDVWVSFRMKKTSMMLKMRNKRPLKLRLWRESMKNKDTMLRTRSKSLFCNNIKRKLRMLDSLLQKNRNLSYRMNIRKSILAPPVQKVTVIRKFNISGQIAMMSDTKKEMRPFL